MLRHFGQDPTPAEIMRSRAPGVYEWVARMWNLRASHEAPALPTRVDAPLAALLVEACETHLVQRGDEHSGGDADALLHVVVRLLRSVVVLAEALLEEHDEPGRDLEELLVVVRAERRERGLPLLVHPVVQVVRSLLFFGGLADLLLHVGSADRDEGPRLHVRTRRGGGSCADRCLDELAGDRPVVEHPHAAAPVHQRMERQRTIPHCVVVDGLVRVHHERVCGREFRARIRVLVGRHRADARSHRDQKEPADVTRGAIPLVCQGEAGFDQERQ